MNRCKHCDRRVTTMPTADGRIVVVDIEQRVYAPVDFGERLQLVRTELAVAEHRCLSKL